MQTLHTAYLTMYEQFIKVFVQAHPLISKDKAYREGQALWRELKKDKSAVEAEIKRLTHHSFA